MICICPCYAISALSSFLSDPECFAFLVPAYPDCFGNEANKWVSEYCDYVISDCYFLKYECVFLHNFHLILRCFADICFYFVTLSFTKLVKIVAVVLG